MTIEEFKAKFYESSRILLLAAVFLGFGLTLSKCSNPMPAPALQIVEAPKASAVIKEEKVDVALQTPRKTVKVYKENVKKKLPIPESVRSNANIQITDSSVIRPSEYTTTATSVLDLSTGATTTYFAESPSPWFSLEDRGSLSLEVGMKRGAMQPVGRVNLHGDFLQTKRIHWGASATAYTDGDWYVGAGGTVRW